MFAKLFKAASILGFFVSTLAAADPIDNLRSCRYSCSQACMNMASNLHYALDDFEASCGGGGVIQPIPQGPQAYLTVNGQTVMYARVGQQVRYDWTSVGGVKATSNFYATGNQSCARGLTNWSANSLQGSLIATVSPAQLGCTFTIRYGVFDQNNNNSTATITLIVVN